MVPSCRFCGHYQPEGRRGGYCAKLHVLVDGNWLFCSLSSPMFNSYASSLEHEFTLIADQIEQKANSNPHSALNGV